MGSKALCMRSTPTAIQSMRENDFECFASTGVKLAKTAMDGGCRTRLALATKGARLAQDREGPHSFLGGGINRVADGRSERWNGWLASPRRRLRALHVVGVDGGHLIHAQG